MLRGEMVDGGWWMLEGSRTTDSPIKIAPQPDGWTKATTNATATATPAAAAAGNLRRREEGRKEAGS